MIRGKLSAPGLALALSLAPAALIAQGQPADWLQHCRGGGGMEARYCEVRVLGFRPEGAIRVDAGRMGGIEVRAWDRDSVQVQARLQVDAGDEAASREFAGQVRVEASPADVRAYVPGGQPRGNWLVTFVVFVPRRSDLVLSVHHGPMAVEGVSGRMELRTGTGPLSLWCVGGDVRGRVGNGPVEVVLGGSRWDGRGLDVETGNGPATLVLPAGYSARLVTGTSSGPPMRIEFPLRTQRQSTHSVETDTGAGGAPVRVVTRLGPARLRRGTGCR